MAETTTVTVTLRGVRVEQLPRLRTAIKSYLQTLASEVKIDAESEKPKKGK